MFVCCFSFWSHIDQPKSWHQLIELATSQMIYMFSCNSITIKNFRMSSNQHSWLSFFPSLCVRVCVLSNQFLQDDRCSMLTEWHGEKTIPFSFICDDCNLKSFTISLSLSVSQYYWPWFLFHKFSSAYLCDVKSLKLSKRLSRAIIVTYKL